MYSIKTLITSQKLSVAATKTDAKTGKLSVDEYTVNGPVVVMVSTTNPNSLTDEEKRRFLILTIDESDEHSLGILMSWYGKSTMLSIIKSRQIRKIWPPYPLPGKNYVSDVDGVRNR